MHRLLSNALCLLSLVLAVAVAALWVRGVSWAQDAVGGPLPVAHATARFVSRGNVFEVTLFYHDPAVTAWNYARYDSRDTRMSWIWLPTFWEASEWPSGRTAGWLLGVPKWQPLLLFAIAPAGWVFLRLRRHTGLCRRCGYDLRGTSGPACPECGEATERVGVCWHKGGPS